MSSIQLKQHSTGDFVSALLLDRLNPAQVTKAASSWDHYVIALGGVVPAADPGRQHLHWDWERKANHFGALLSYRFMGIECDAELQGLMLVCLDYFGQEPSQRGKPIVYVKYLAAAPWNNAALTTSPRYGLVGSVLLAAATQLSIDEGYHGRVGLHSLPQADTFYSKTIQMTALGHDVAENLNYFEMTPEQAKRFLER